MDGVPMHLYQKEDLQGAVALLTQDHSLFSFSIAETIGIGDPERVNDRARIEEAAKLGGAWNFVQKCSRGLDDVLQPISTSFASEYPMKDVLLREILDDVEKQKDVSGVYTITVLFML